jgi:hypothetical protein
VAALLEITVLVQSLNFTTIAKIFCFTSWPVASKATTIRPYDAENRLHVTSLLTILHVIYSVDDPSRNLGDVGRVLDRLFFTWVGDHNARKKLCSANFGLAIRTLFRTRCHGILLKLIFDGSVDICDADTRLYLQGDADQTYIKNMILDIDNDTASLDSEHLARMLDSVLDTDWFGDHDADDFEET